MAHAPLIQPGTARRVRAAGLALAFTWALFWAGFGLLSGIGEGLDPAGVLMHTAVPGLLFLAAAVAAWRWPVSGAALLVLAGVFALVMFPFASSPMGLLTLALPPFAAAVLVVLAQARR